MWLRRPIYHFSQLHNYNPTFKANGAKLNNNLAMVVLNSRQAQGAIVFVDHEDNLYDVAKLRVAPMLNFEFELFEDLFHIREFVNFAKGKDQSSWQMSHKDEHSIL